MCYGSRITVSCNCIDEYRERLKESYKLEAEVMQLSQGGFENWQNNVYFPSFFCGVFSSNSKVFHFAKLPEDTYYIVLPTAEGHIIADGQNLNTSFPVLIYGPSEESHNIFPNNYTCHVLCIKKCVFTKYFAPQEVEMINAATTAIRIGIYPLNDPLSFRDKAIRFINNLIDNSNIASNEEMLIDYIMSELCQLLMPVITYNSTENSLPSKSTNCALNRAIEYLSKSPKPNISVLELAESTYTTVRNLQIVFQKEFRMSPKRFLVIRRLHFLRSQLKKQNKKTVRQYAASLSLKNATRLNREYSRHFGEKIIETIAINE